MAELQQLLKGKTPVSFLQEICSKKKLTANYDILANEGLVHEPVFVMRAQAGEFQGTSMQTYTCMYLYIHLHVCMYYEYMCDTSDNL